MAGFQKTCAGNCRNTGLKIEERNSSFSLGAIDSKARHRAGIAFGLEAKRLSLALIRKTMEKNYE